MPQRVKSRFFSGGSASPERLTCQIRLLQDLVRVRIPQDKASNLESWRPYFSFQPCAPSLRQLPTTVSLRHKSRAFYPVPPLFATSAGSKSVYSSYDRTAHTFGALVPCFLARAEPKPQIIGSGIYTPSNPTREFRVLSPLSIIVVSQAFVKCGRCLAGTLQPVYVVSFGSR